MSYYRYYKQYPGENYRPEWMVYIDHLRELGRSYPKPVHGVKDYEYLNDIEYRRLISLLFEDNTLCEREEIMFNEYNDEISLAVIGYVESLNKDAEERISTMIVNNIMNYFKEIVEDIFDNIRSDFQPQHEGEADNE